MSPPLSIFTADFNLNSVCRTHKNAFTFFTQALCIVKSCFRAHLPPQYDHNSQTRRLCGESLYCFPVTFWDFLFFLFIISWWRKSQTDWTRDKEHKDRNTPMVTVSNLVDNLRKDYVILCKVNINISKANLLIGWHRLCDVSVTSFQGSYAFLTSSTRYK